MKTISIRDLQKNIRKCVDVSQKEHVVVTRHGKPAAIVIGVEGNDWEDVMYQTSPAFWKMIEERRKGKTLSLSEVRKRIEAKWKKQKRPE